MTVKPVISQILSAVGQPSSVLDMAKDMETSKNAFMAVLGEINKEQRISQGNMMNISTGRETNLQKAVLEIDKASMSLQLALEVKNKVLSAYKEVMNIQV